MVFTDMMTKILAVFAFTSLIGCYGVEEINFFDSIEKYCQNGNSQLDLQKMTDFDWDEAYIFSEGLSQYDVEQVIGISCGGSSEFVSRIIFLNAGKIIHYSEKEHNSSNSYAESFRFEFPDYQRGFFRVSPDNSRFEITKVRIDQSLYFVLKPASM